MPLPFEYPKSPPIWLPEWPSRLEVAGLFAAGLRTFAPRMMQKSPVRQVNWTDQALAVTFGSQHTVWRLVGDQWVRNCSCGYKHDRCVHAYAAARVFEQIAEEQNWLRKKGPEPGPAAPQQPAKTRRPPAPNHPRNHHQLELFGATTQVIPGQTERLEAEADFHHEPGAVVLRFYRFANDQREILRLQQLYNLGMTARHSEAAKSRWSDDDRRFLPWLAGQIKGSRPMRQNLNVFKLSPERFDQWRNTWEDQPGRFIDRATQQRIGSQADAATMHVELTLQDEGWVEIALVVAAPNGTSRPFHEIFQGMAEGQRQVVLGGALVGLDPPLSWSLITDIFARRSPRMPRDKVCEFLPDLLEHRLDIVFGPAVERQDTQALCEVVGATEGADILIHCTVGGCPIHPDTRTAADALTETDHGFVITTFRSTDLAAVRAFMKALDGQAADNQAIRVPGRRDAVAALAKAWRDLPARVSRRCTPELEPLLGGDLSPVAELTIRDDGAFVEAQVSWCLGDGIHISAEDVAEALAGAQPVFRTRSGHWLEVDPEVLKAAQQKSFDLGFSRHGGQRLFRPEARQMIDRINSLPDWALHERSRQRGRQLLTEAPVVLPRIPAALQDVLRPYQRQGVEFMIERMAYGVGAVLADDMGLGKTLQVLAVLAAFLEQDASPPRGAGALVVCPASVVAVWLHEVAKFYPTLRARAYAGSPAERTELLKSRDWDLLVTNYALLRNDADTFLGTTFDAVVLDEAQRIKNPDAQVTQVAKRLRTEHAIALTGTPLENRLLDLWSILDFVNPGFLGTREDFIETFEGPTDRASLARRVAPLIIRRTKERVAPELPPRIEETLTVEMLPGQRALYDEELLRARAAVKEKGPIEVLAALTRLRQICCDPRLLVDDADGTLGSAKLDTLIEMLEEIISEGHSVLVFSQFTSMLKLILPVLQQAGMPAFILTGETPTAKRAKLVAAFNESQEPQIFLLSLKAAGTGLTLTKADYVFLFDPWWNPAVERQAIDRTHRIGQDKPVIAYRLVAARTIEEKVLEMQAEKAALFADVMADAERDVVPQRLTAADLAALLG